MSLTALIWFATFVGFSIAAFRRPIWGLAIYWLTYYASPPFWWWGDPMNAITNRWSLLSALVALVAVFRAGNFELDSISKRLMFFFGVYVVNATVVHMVFADDPVRSYKFLVSVWKFYVLAFVGLLAIRTRKDFEYALWFILIGSFYIAYEVIINDRGSWREGRLELYVIPQAGGANAMGGLFAYVLPLGAAFLLGDKKKWIARAALVLILVFIFETVLRCNSRAVFLSLIAAGAVWLVMAPGKAKKRAIVGLLLVALAVTTMVKSEKIINRFKSTFVPAEERDDSANQRIILWKAAREMMKDYPLGLGGDCAFNSPIGRQYLREHGIYVPRAVHNGYLDIGTGWGKQGLAIYLGMILISLYSVMKATYRTKNWDAEWNLIGVGLIASLAIIAVCVVFGSTLDNEWVIWWLFLAATFSRLGNAKQIGEPIVSRGSFADEKVGGNLAEQIAPYA